MPIVKLDENGKVIYGADDPEFVGAMPIRQDIEVLPADKPLGPQSWKDYIIVASDGSGVKEDRPWTIGFRVFETIGVGVINTQGIVAGKKSVIIGNK